MAKRKSSGRVKIDGDDAKKFVKMIQIKFSPETDEDSEDDELDLDDVEITDEDWERFEEALELEDEIEFFTVQNAIAELIRRKEQGLDDRPDHDKLVNEIEEIYRGIVEQYIIKEGYPKGGHWPGSDIVEQ